jgi:hypothetical protein
VRAEGVIAAERHEFVPLSSRIVINQRFRSAADQSVPVEGSVLCGRRSGAVSTEREPLDSNPERLTSDEAVCLRVTGSGFVAVTNRWNGAMQLVLREYRRPGQDCNRTCAVSIYALPQKRFLVMATRSSI